MARQDSGKWVARAAATGGGRSYRGQMPVKWYGSLVLIVLIGVVSVVYSRYERQNPVAGTPPTTGTHWYAAFAIDICGTVQPNLPANPNSASNPGLHTDGDGVIRIEPTKQSDAGNNATLARFVSEYPKFGLTADSLTIPGEKVRNDGEKCPKQTPDAGKSAKLQIKVWPPAQPPGSAAATTSSDPAALKLGNNQLITVAFVPSGSKIPKPSAAAITAMLQAVSQAGQTTTTTGVVPLNTTTTAAGSSSTPTTVPLTTAPSTTVPTTTGSSVAPSTSTTKAG
ncbi:MAG TPA: hypothetical protein VNC61_14215 [Acidimicrobiales bacterium]|nr:hypothetical protein [Acidimicrobiales bacterium]